MAGMPKQGYTNLVLAGWVPDPALGCGALGSSGGPWGELVALGTPRWPPQGWREREVEVEVRKNKAGGKEKRVSPSAAILSGLNFTLSLKI